MKNYIEFPKRAILYCREEEGAIVEYINSLEGQQRVLEDYCGKMNIEIVGFFHEINAGLPFTGTELRKIQNMVALPGNKANLLLVTEWHKFSGDFSYALGMLVYLRNHGVVVRAVLQQDPKWEAFNYFINVFKVFGWTFNPQ